MPNISAFLIFMARRETQRAVMRKETYRTSTIDCLAIRTRVNCLFGARIDGVGAYGRNDASENAEELKETWKGIGCEMLNTREAGM